MLDLVPSVVVLCSAFSGIGLSTAGTRDTSSMSLTKDDRSWAVEAARSQEMREGDGRSVAITMTGRLRVQVTGSQMSKSES